MKEKIFAFITIILIIVAVASNTIKMHKDIDEIYSAVENIDIEQPTNESRQEAHDAYDLFKKKEHFIGLTVNHDDLSNIEDCFAEMIGNLKTDDPDGATVAKNRLLNALSHLRRLSSFNIDAII